MGFEPTPVPMTLPTTVAALLLSPNSSSWLPPTIHALRHEYDKVIATREYPNHASPGGGSNPLKMTLVQSP